MLGLGLGVFMATLDASIVNISLPTLVEALHAEFVQVQWVVLSYVLILTSLMLGVARLGDLYGKKKLYLSGVTLFTFGSLLCALSPTVETLIAARAVQGLGAVFMQALGIAIIAEVFPANERGQALGLNTSVVSVGLGIGPPLGGILIGLWGWRSIFLVNLPVGILALLVVWRTVPTIPAAQHGQRFDPLGALVMLITLVCYALGMTFGQAQGFDNLLPLALLCSALIGFSIFVFTEQRIPSPMVDLRLFHDTLFSINLLMGFLVFIVLSGAFIFPFFLKLVAGYPARQVGLLLMVQPVLMGLVAPLAGRLSDHYGARLISLIGLGLIVIGCLAVSTLHQDVTAVGFILRVAPLGIGMGIFQSPNSAAIMSAVPRLYVGIASGLLALTRTLGNTTGLPLMGAIFSAFVLSNSGLDPNTQITSAPATALVNGITATYRVAAMIVFLSALLAGLAWLLDRRRQQKRKPQPDSTTSSPNGSK